MEDEDEEEEEEEKEEEKEKNEMVVEEQGRMEKWGGDGGRRRGREWRVERILVF